MCSVRRFTPGQDRVRRQFFWQFSSFPPAGPMTRSPLTYRRSAESATELSRGQAEAGVTVRGDLVGASPVGADTADIGHEDAGLTRDVRPEEPRVRRPGIEGGARRRAQLLIPC